MTDKKKTVVLGISGGVDSSVAAYLLKEQGYHVIGVFMKNWDENDEECTATDDYLDVVKVANALDIKYYTVNFEKEYWDTVFTYFLNEYKKGRTPNPDVMCNQNIKFKAFLDFALKLGADYIAMGHYARVKHENGHSYLLRGVDENKDQSYFLSRVKEEALKKTIFPIGDIKKERVREIAEELNLATAKKKDSTGVCFIGERDFNKFLDKFLFTKPGKIVDEAGNVLGEHSGLMHYTIGQRKGIGIGGVGTGEPFFVADKNLEKNELIVAQGVDNPILYRDEFYVEEPFFINGTPDYPLNCTGKIRYRAPDVGMVVTKIDDETLKVKLEKPLKGVTPGQIAVFYSGEICLGSGIIK